MGEGCRSCHPRCKELKTVKGSGWSGRDRTCDVEINSLALYRLSYTPILFSGIGHASSPSDSDFSFSAVAHAFAASIDGKPS